jgi:hypothetical protein
MAPGLGGTIEFEARFWAVDGERRAMAFKLIYAVVGQEDGKFGLEWHYTSGPDFT